MKEERFVEAACAGKDWRNAYDRKRVSAEEAVRHVASGDRVVFPVCAYPRLIGPALAARKDELRNVTIHTDAALDVDLGDFFQEDQSDEVFSLTSWYVHDLARKSPAGTDARRTAYLPGTWSQMMKPFDERPDRRPFSIDVAVVTVSPPDGNEFCSFGANLWHARSYCKRARTVLAQVDETMIRTGGTNHIHVSELDWIVEATPELLSDEEQAEILAGTPPGVRDLIEPFIPMIPVFRRKWVVSMLPLMNDEIARMALRRMTFGEPPPEARAMAGYVSELVRDGDTFSVGHGSLSAWLGPCGAFDGKHDLGLYCEGVWPGFTTLLQQGVITGKHKVFRPGKVTASAYSHAHQQDLEFIDGNPIFESYDAEYVLDIRNIARNDNFVAINQGVSVDLTGQINAECSPGGRMISGPGGQPELHIGGVLSRGGRSITVLPSTALGGTVSTIVPRFEGGTVVTIPRYFADYVVTEHGIAALMGKDCRQRAHELISVAHPDFREGLRGEARRRFHP